MSAKAEKNNEIDLTKVIEFAKKAKKSAGELIENVSDEIRYLKDNTWVLESVGIAVAALSVIGGTAVGVNALINKAEREGNLEAKKFEIVTDELEEIIEANHKGLDVKDFQCISMGTAEEFEYDNRATGFMYVEKNEADIDAINAGELVFGEKAYVARFNAVSENSIVNGHVAFTLEGEEIFRINEKNEQEVDTQYSVDESMVMQNAKVMPISVMD